MPSLSHGLVKQGSFNQIVSFNSCDISDANSQTNSAFIFHVYPFPKAAVPFYVHGEPYEAIHTRHLWYDTENSNCVNSVFEREKDVMCSECQAFSAQFLAAGGKNPSIKVKSIFWMHLCLIAARTEVCVHSKIWGVCSQGTLETWTRASLHNHPVPFCCFGQHIAGEGQGQGQGQGFRSMDSESRFYDTKLFRNQANIESQKY